MGSVFPVLGYNNAVGLAGTAVMSSVYLIPELVYKYWTVSVLDLNGAVPPLCLMPTLPSLLHPQTCEISVFLSDLPACRPAALWCCSSAYCAPWETDHLQREPEGACGVKAAFCHTGMQTLACERELSMVW